MENNYICAEKYIYMARPNKIKRRSRLTLRKIRKRNDHCASKRNHTPIVTKKDIDLMNAERYEKIFSDEILPYAEYLNKYGVQEARTAIRVTDNPAEPSNFISKREIALAQRANNEGEEYLEIPPRPAKMTKKKVLEFLSERGLSHFVSFEKADEAMSNLYDKLASSYGVEAAEGFFEQHGRYMVEMRYDENAGWFLSTNAYGHFDLVRKPDFDYKKYITDNYREVNIKWQIKE